MAPAFRAPRGLIIAVDFSSDFNIREGALVYDSSFKLAALVDCDRGESRARLVVFSGGRRIYANKKLVQQLMVDFLNRRLRVSSPVGVRAVAQLVERRETKNELCFLVRRVD